MFVPRSVWNLLDEEWNSFFCEALGCRADSIWIFIPKLKSANIHRGKQVYPVHFTGCLISLREGFVTVSDADYKQIKWRMTVI